MKTLLCLILSAAIVTLGILSNTLRKERVAKTPGRVPFDLAIQKRMSKSDHDLQKMIDRHCVESNAFVRAAIALRADEDKAYRERIHALEQKIQSKEEENKRPPCQRVSNFGDCITGLFRFEENRLSGVERYVDIPYIVEVAVRDGDCVIVYSNCLSRAVKPDLKFRFYAKDGVPLAEVHNKWRFSSIAPGEVCTEKESVDLCVGQAYWARVLDQKKGQE